MKEKIDKYFNENYFNLKEYFQKFATENEKPYFDNLYTNLYIHVIDNQNKLKDLINRGELNYYCVTFIYNQRNWHGTDFKKSMIIKENNSENLEFNESIFEETDIEALSQKEIEINEKLAKIAIALNDLELHEKILYDKYFNKGESLRKIGNDIGVSHVSIFQSVKPIKEKIRNTKIK